MRRVLPLDEKFEFVKTSMAWIHHNIMDSCFILNFGYEAPLSWPQVQVKDLFEIFMMSSKGINEFGK